MSVLIKKEMLKTKNSNKIVKQLSVNSKGGKHAWNKEKR